MDRPDATTAEQAAVSQQAARSRLDAIADTRKQIIDFIAEYRAAHHTADPTPTTDSPHGV